MGNRKSVEDYLENILLLGDHVHAVDIAARMCVSKAAVTKALKILVEKDFVSITNHHVNLTDSGKTYADKVYSKHQLITRLWTKLGVDDQTAERDACLTEHILSETTLMAIKNFLEKN